MIDILTQNGLAGLLSLLIGKWAKNKEWIANAVIPILTFVINVLALAIAPAPAAAAISLAPAAPYIGLFAQAALNNLFITGLHSTFKNTIIPALKLVGIEISKFVIGKLGGK